MIRELTKGKVINKELRCSVYYDESGKKTPKFSYWIEFVPFALHGRRITREITKEFWDKFECGKVYDFSLHSNGDQIFDTGRRW